MAAANKWGKQYWTDLAERVGATLIGAILSALTVTGTTSVDWSDGEIVWAIIGVPTLVSLLKGLLMNLGGGLPSASLANVSSLGDPTSDKPPAGERGATGFWSIIGALVAIIVVVWLLTLIF
jgi:hypothetical protein